MSQTEASAVRDPRFPIGRFDFDMTVTPERLAEAIDTMARVPKALREAMHGLTPQQVETPHREGGWNPRQIAHHIPDSHLNGYTRMKLALTEDAPTIKPYHEDRWAELGDVQTTPVEVSFLLLETLHLRWVALARSLDSNQWKRPFVHPETGRRTPIDLHLCHYAWHGRHHVAQITSLRERMGW
ncbi:MAG TPA: putative metal-dependent hydrolase [Candidatus Eisenbacteria bacterium]|jgi:hypothetical protein|nr:putative metal-dependent hydrolase [Candidatus Eisenbacteria bacterium]